MQRSTFIRRIPTPSVFIVTALFLLFAGTSQAGYMADVLAQRPTPAPSPQRDGDTQSSADAVSAGRAIQFTPDYYDCLAHGQVCGASLFQANIGNERWSINGDFATDIFTGNVFFEDLHAPVFLWCPIVGVNGTTPTGSFVLHCFAAANCVGGCSQGQWQDLGLVPLAMSYILP